MTLTICWKQSAKPTLITFQRADIEALDCSIAENGTLPYGELRAKSHGEEWCRAYKQAGRKVMDIVGMAKDAMASEDMINYIEENLAVEAALA